jgi:hypothetical protein
MKNISLWNFGEMLGNKCHNCVNEEFYDNLSDEDKEDLRRKTSETGVDFLKFCVIK